MHKKTKVIIASIMALTMVAPTVASVSPITASAGQVLGETSFDYKALPWHTCESSPAKQDFDITSDGTFHVKVLVPEGGDHEKWDLQFRYRNLNFKAGHEYTVSFKVKGSRPGMELCSKIGNIKGNEEYFELDGGTNDMHLGPAFQSDGGSWPQAAVKLTDDWQEFKGTFKPPKDLEGVEWAFHYAKGTKYQGNAQEGDEIWFDDMSIICETCSDCDAGHVSYGQTNRYWSGLENNYISVNQLGYYTDLKKVAVLGDNQGDILHDSEKITLSGTYTWELVDASSGTAVKTGTTSAVTKDKDSADSVAKIDFSDFKTPGTYYLRIQGEKWRSFEFKIADDIYSQKYGKDYSMLTNSLNYFYQNRSGLDIEEKYITSGEDKSTLAHPGGHKTDTASVQTEWKNEYAKKEEATGTYASSKITANKGWYDAGDHGKYVVNGGIAVWTLQNMYERAQYASDTSVQNKFGDSSKTIIVPEAGNKIPDLLDECKYELDFIHDMKVDASEPTYGAKYEGLYYHKLHDHKWTGLATKPWDYEGPQDQGGWDTVRIVKPPTLAATLNYAACAGQAARLWKDVDASQAKEYLDEAKAAYQAYKRCFYEADLTETTHPDLGCPCPKEELNKNSLYAPMWQAKGGGPYGDNEVHDDAYWAACEIFVSASELGDADAATYKKELEEYKNAYLTPERISGGENKDGSLTVFNWGNTASAGTMTLALHKDLLDAADVTKMEKSIVDCADTYLKLEEDQGYGIPYTYDGPGYNDPNNLNPSITIYGYEWGSNSMVINNLILMGYAYDQTQDTKYLNGITQGMDYLLGTNPLSFSYITGYGSYHEKNPHHRYWSHELDKELPMAPDGVLSGGPNAGLQDPYVRALGFVPGKKDNPSQRCFVDSIEAWSTNEVTINWNAPLAWIAEFLEDKDVTYTMPGAGEKQETTAPTEETTAPGEETKPVKPGDADWGNVNCSAGASPAERVDVADAVLLARYLTEDPLAKTTSQGLLNADVNASGKPDTEDTIKILKYIARLISYDCLGTKDMIETN